MRMFLYITDLNWSMDNFIGKIYRVTQNRCVFVQKSKIIKMISEGFYLEENDIFLILSYGEIERIRMYDDSRKIKILINGTKIGYIWAELGAFEDVFSLEELKNE